jgi:histidinol-phosphate/aromatic aminotransferase/cobyric acid decarboxylase-like protein
MSADELYGELQKHSILVRRCGDFSSLGDNYFRIAVRDREDNLKLTSELARIAGR